VSAPQGKDWARVIAELAGVLVLAAPLMPDARTRWWMAMRACQNIAHGVGRLALRAENRYRREVG
jgi:hypothetical protein